MTWARNFFRVISVIFGALGGSFFRALDGFANWGGVSQIGGGFTFLIAALYWMIRVSKFNRDIFKLIAACSPSPLARSGAAGRLIFDTPVAGDDQLMMILTNFE